MKTFKGKAIYNPSGKAGEYSYWACNFYVGCSNGCDYCYCKKGILAGAMGQDRPVLKKGLIDRKTAIEIFIKEVNMNIVELREHGLFFSFSTDPMLPETIELTLDAAGIATGAGVPVKILTKCAGWVDELISFVDNSNGDNLVEKWRRMHAFGFTLTGHDELEPGASTNMERILAIIKLHEAGFRTFASIEPIIDFESSKEVIRQTAGYCDLYKIGLMSGKKYDKKELCDFIKYCNSAYMSNDGGFYRQKNYFKDSLLKQAGIDRSDLPVNCVGRDYNMFIEN